jgi:hypothetical protein
MNSTVDLTGCVELVVERFSWVQGSMPERIEHPYPRTCVPEHRFARQAFIAGEHL